MTQEEIVALHDEIFAFLFEKYLEARAKGEEFYFRIWVDGNLRPGFIFFGNANWLQLSFWTGFSSNQNYVISLIVNAKMKNIALRVSTNDEGEVATKFKKELSDLLTLENDSKFYGNYADSHELMAKLTDFIQNDKQKIDDYLDSVSSPFIQKIKEENFTADIFKKEFIAQSSLHDSNFITPIENTSLLPYQVRRLSIKNYHGIIDININDIPQNTHWIFVTGENGIGKTVFLQAIALGLQALGEDEHSRQRLIAIEYEGNNLSNFAFNRPSYSSNGYELPSSDIPTVAYGHNRVNEVDFQGINVPIGHLFGKRSLVKTDDWLKSLLQSIDFQTQELRDNDQLQKDKNIFEILQSTFQQILNIQKIELDAETKAQVLYIDQDESKVTFEQLSAGYQNILKLITDIILCLSHETAQQSKPYTKLANIPQSFQYYGSVFRKPQDLSGIVIIDEFENHLHAKFQRKLVEMLTDLFPKVQFIVSTHSPIPLLGAPKESVILHVERNKEEGITVERIFIKNIENLQPNLLLTSPIFGLQDIFNIENKNVADIETEDDYATMLENEARRKRLKERFLANQNS